MMRTIWMLALLLAGAPIVHAQSLGEYMRLRRHYGIREAAGVEALDAFVGSRVLEVKGVVKGSFKIGSIYTLLLEREDGSALDIDTNTPPGWLGGGDVHARLLVQAVRRAENSEPKIKLLGAAPEQSVSPSDAHRQSKRATAPGKKPSAAQKHVDWNLPETQVMPIYAKFIRKQNRRLTEQDANLIARGIIGFSLKYGVDARLIMAMVMVESGFDPNSTSKTGARGLGQLMPGTAKWMGVSDSYDTVDNLYGTVKLIRGHLDKYQHQTGGNSYESLVLALAAYNAGEGAVSKHRGVPPYRETQAYVRRVVGLYAQFAGVR